MAGSITKSTGVLKFEKRDERIYSGCSNSSCGWNRHTRLLANLAMTAGEPTGLTSLSYGYADVQVTSAALADGTAATSSGKIITASGSLAGGIKARIFKTSGQTTTQMKTVGQWTEAVATGCMTGPVGIDSTANCTSNTGISNFTTNTQFGLFASTAQLSPAAWLAAFSGFTFSSINLDSDQAF
jgi:hypothetical protein